MGICVNLRRRHHRGKVTRLLYTVLLVVSTGHVRRIGLQLRTEYIVTLGNGHLLLLTACCWTTTKCTSSLSGLLTQECALVGLARRHQHLHFSQSWLQLQSSDRSGAALIRKATRFKQRTHEHKHICSIVNTRALLLQTFDV